MIGIVSYGSYIPKNRLKIADIASAWGKNPKEIEQGLGLREKSVPSIDEDSVTMAIEASYNALKSAQIKLEDIGVITVGSESHPYAVKPTSTIVAGILGIEGNYLAADLEFACKAGSAGMQFIAGLVESERVKMGMAIGSDAAQAKPGDVLEYTAASGAVCIALGKEKVLAQLLDFSSFSSDTPDFYRRDGEIYPSHTGRFTGEPAYFHHVISASKNLLQKVKMEPKDFDFCVFHMPNSKFPTEVAKRLGFTPRQLAAGFIVNKIGNPYCASSLLGLAATLDIARPDQKIFVCSYGSGAGSDAFYFKTTTEIAKFHQKQTSTVQTQIENKKYINYPEIIKRSIR